MRTVRVRNEKDHVVLLSTNRELCAGMADIDARKRSVRVIILLLKGRLPFESLIHWRRLVVRNEEPVNPVLLPKHIDTPIDILERRKRQRIEEHAAEMKLLDQAINRLKGNGHVVAGMFIGLEIKDALTVYLNL